MRLVALFLIYTFLLAAPTVHAQEVSKEALQAEIDKALRGEVSLDELAEYLIHESEKSSKFSILYKNLNPKIKGIADAAAGQILKKVKILAEKSKLQSASSVLELGRIIIPEEWAERKRARQIYESSKLLEEIKSEQNFDKLLKVDFKFTSKLDQQSFESSLRKTASSFVERAKSRENLFLAFKELALLSSFWSDIGAKEAAVDTLDRLAAQSDGNDLSPKDWTFDYPEVQSFIHELIAEDKSRRNNFVLLYEWITQRALASGREKKALVYYNWVLGNRPDPDPANVSFRKKLIAAGKSGTTDRFIKDRIKELTAAGELSFSDKFELLLKGYFGSSIIFTLIFMVLFVFGCVLLVFLKPGLIQGLMSLLGEKTSSAASKRKAKKGVRYAKAVVEDDEYTRLLAKFGLKDGASEAQIKKAFRRAVKKHHPDAHGTEGVVLDEEGNVDKTFEELRKTYDRILEIRGGWFGK